MKQSEKDLKRVFFETMMEVQHGKKIRWFPDDTDFITEMQNASTKGETFLSQTEYEYYRPAIDSQLKAKSEAEQELAQLELQRSRERNDSITIAAQKYLEKYNERIPLQRRMSPDEIKKIVKDHTGSIGPGNDRLIDLQKVERVLGARFNDTTKSFTRVSDSNEFENK